MSIYAQSWTLGNIINLDFASEQIGYKLLELPNRSFDNTQIQGKYNQLQQMNLLLIEGFYKQYRLWKIDYYSTQGIITAHQKFVYYAGQLFTHLDMKTQFPDDIEVDENIIRSYNHMRTSYRKVQALYNNSK